MFYTGHSNSERSGLVNKMTNSVYEMPTDEYNKKLAETLKQIPEFEVPDWAEFVKTGISKERPPVEDDFWFKRAASILRQLYIKGPVGVGRLRIDAIKVALPGVKPNKWNPRKEIDLTTGGKPINSLISEIEHGRSNSTKQTEE